MGNSVELNSAQFVSAIILAKTYTSIFKKSESQLKSPHVHVKSALIDGRIEVITSSKMQDGYNIQVEFEMEIDEEKNWHISPSSKTDMLMEVFIDKSVHDEYTRYTQARGNDFLKKQKGMPGCKLDDFYFYHG